jgi:predicted DNA-binding protein
MRKQAQFTVTVPRPKLRQLTALAKEDGRSRSNYVERVLDRHIAELEAKAA